MFKNIALSISNCHDSRAGPFTHLYWDYHCGISDLKKRNNFYLNNSKINHLQYSYAPHRRYTPWWYTQTFLEDFDLIKLNPCSWFTSYKCVLPRNFCRSLIVASKKWHAPVVPIEPPRPYIASHQRYTGIPIAALGKSWSRMYSSILDTFRWVVVANKHIPMKVRKRKLLQMFKCW